MILRALLLATTLSAAGAVLAQSAQLPPQPPAKPAAKPPAKAVAKKAVVRPAWAELTSGQQEVLAPLKPEWDRLDRDRRMKWVGIAKRYPTMKPEQQTRVQRRMEAWVRLTPEQRRQARENYKNIAKVPPERRGDLRQQWAEYQAQQGIVPQAPDANKP